MRRIAPSPAIGKNIGNGEWSAPDQKKLAGIEGGGSLPDARRSPITLAASATGLLEE
jgi:hypothetical protein